MRRAAKSDASQASIVAALRKAAWHVWIIGLPVDLLLWKPGKGFRLLEVKTATKSGKAPIRKDRAKQNEFCELTGTPRVTSAESALKALKT